MMKKIYVMVFLGLFLLPLRAEACAFCGKYKVSNVEKGDVLNLRQGPSVNSAKVGALPYNGVGIEIAGECTDNGWCTVSFFGTEAWVNTKYLTRMDEQK